MSIGVAAVLLVGGLAFAGYHLYLNEVEDSAIELVPPDAVFYVNLYLNPSTRQKQALRDLLRDFPSAGSTDEAAATTEDLFDGILEPLGLGFAEDIKPWLGRQVGAYAVLEGLQPPAGAFLIATNDPDATMEAVATAAEKRNENLEPRVYKGVEYQVAGLSNIAVGIVGDFLVVASGPPEFEASVEAEMGRSLTDTSVFAETTRRLPSDRIALFFVNLKPAVDALRQTGSGIGSLNVDALGSPAAAVAYLRSDALVLEGSFPGGGGRSGDILAEIPALASVGVAVEDVGGYLTDQLDILGPFGAAAADAGLQNATGLDLEDDLLSWMGGLSFYFALDDRPVIALEVESRDPAKSAAALEKIQIALIREGVRLQRVDLPGLDGYRVRIPGSNPVLVLAGGEGVVVASSEQAALSAVRPEERLGDDPQYRTAVGELGAGFSPALFARVGPILEMIGHELEHASASAAAAYEEVKPDLQPFSFIIYGSRREGDRTHGRVVIGVE